MERRKIIIYAILVITLAYGIYFHFLSGDSQKTSLQDTGPATATVKATYALPAQQDSSFWDVHKTEDTEPKGNNSRTRNPFLKESRSKANVGAVSKPVHYARPIVTAVSPGGPDSFAIANGRLLRIGETIGAWTLIKAENGRALFSGPGGSIWVKVGG